MTKNNLFPPFIFNKDGVSLTLSQRRSKSSLIRSPQTSRNQRERSITGVNLSTRNHSNIGSKRIITQTNRKVRTPSPKLNTSIDQESKDRFGRYKIQQNGLRSSTSLNGDGKSIEAINRRPQANRSTMARNQRKNSNTQVEQFQSINSRLLNPIKNTYAKKQFETKQSYLIQPQQETINMSYNPTVESLHDEKTQEYNSFQNENSLQTKSYLGVYQQSININIQQQQNRSQFKINQKSNLLRDIASNNIDKNRSNSPFKLQNNIITKIQNNQIRRNSYCPSSDPLKNLNMNRIVNSNTLGYVNINQTPIQTGSQTHRVEPIRINNHPNWKINQQLNLSNRGLSPINQNQKVIKKVLTQKNQFIPELVPRYSQTRTIQKENQQPFLKPITPTYKFNIDNVNS